MKKLILAITFSLICSSVFAFGFETDNQMEVPFPTIENGMNTGNNTVIGSDGTYYDKIGNTVYSSDGTYYDKIGNTVYSSDGTYYDKIGNTVYKSDGTYYEKIGNTIYGSDGTYYDNANNTYFTPVTPFEF